jgi:hypothetical protein
MDLLISAFLNPGTEEKKKVGIGGIVEKQRQVIAIVSANLHPESSRVSYRFRFCSSDGTRHSNSKGGGKP